MQDKTEGNGVGERTLADNMPNEHSENNADHEGVMFTALRKGFVQAQQHKQREFEMSTSVVEIYNERAVDLLSNRQELQIRHRRVHGFYLEGLKRAVCSDVAEATEVLKRALAYRFVVLMLPRQNCSACTALAWPYTCACSGVLEHTR